MKRKKESFRYIIKIIFIIVHSVIYFSCGNSGGTSGNGKEEPLIPVEEVEYKAKFYNVSPNKEVSIEGAGPLKIAIVNNEFSFSGVLNEAFATEKSDKEIMNLIGSTILEINENFEFTDGGIVNRLDVVTGKNPKVILGIRENIKWSDGSPFSIDDVIFTYETILHKDFNGNKSLFYGNRVLGNIIGAQEYWDGKTKNIKGIRKKDDRTVEISLKEIPAGIFNIVSPSILRFAIPKHYLKDIPVKDMFNSEKIRKNIVTLGPYVPTEIIPGKGIKARANEYYFHGRPKIENIEIETVPSLEAYEGMKNGLYDIAIGLETRGYSEKNDKWGNIYTLGNMQLGFSEMVFNLGYWDKGNKENVMDPNAKMGDKRLRQALAHALDIQARLDDSTAKRIYTEVNEKAVSPIPPIIKRYHNQNLKGYPYNPEKAEKLLDEAGYRDIDGDGIREDKNGQPFEIRISYSQSEMKDLFTNEAINPEDTIRGYYIKMWKKIGIKATLVSIPEKDYVNKMYENIKGIDIFLSNYRINKAGGFNPVNFSSKKSSDNISRFVSEEMENLIRETVSERAQKDLGYKIQAYKKWQEYFMEEIPILPTYYSQDIILVNKRVKNFYIFIDNTRNSLYLTELTAEKPYKAKQ